MTRTPWLAAVLGAALCAPCVALAQQAATLGELALKEQERRKALQATGKVLTNDDLPKPPAPATPAAGSGQAAGSAKADKTDQAAKPDAPKPEDTRDETWWKQRMSQVREELRRNEMFAEALQTRINS